MLGVRLLVSKAALATRIVEPRSWLDGQHYHCCGFAAQDRGDQIELEIQFFEAAQANAFVKRFGGETVDLSVTKPPLLTKEEMAALLSGSEAERGESLPTTGPWAAGISASERRARWRQMTLEALHFCGDSSPVVKACIAAELDPRAAEWAWRALQAIDSDKHARIMLAGESAAGVAALSKLAL